MEETLKKLFTYLCLRWEDQYIGLQGWSDVKVGQPQKFVKANIKNFNKFLTMIKTINVDSELAVGFCINQLREPKRRNSSVTKINHILIDLDGQNIHKDYMTVKAFLKANSIIPLYEDKSGNGYHFLIPIEFELQDQSNSEKFLKIIKKVTEISSLDHSVKLLTQILRVPESIHRKTGKDIILETLEWNYVNQSIVEDNTKNIRDIIAKHDFDEMEKVPHQQDEIEKDDGDFFFSTLLKSAKLRKKLSRKNGIAKNDILFKNLAIFLIRNPKFAKTIYPFIGECGHSKNEFDGWVNKVTSEEITRINYLEIKNWIINYKLTFLQTIIEQQILLQGNWLNRYEICFVKNTIIPVRYLLFDKKKRNVSRFSESDMYKTILIEANFNKFNFIEYYGISIWSKDGQELTEKQKNNKIINKIQKTIDKYALINPIFDIGYKPTAEKYYEEMGERFLNIYKTGPLENFYEHSEHYNFPYIKKLIMNLVNDDENGYNYFCKWLSFILCNPEIKIPSSIVFMGTQGIGKGRLREWILPGIFGEWNVMQINNSNLEEKWGDWLVSKRFIVANEIKVSGRHKDFVRKKIKEYSTDSEVSVQLKGRDTIKIKNYSHWLFFSDQEIPFEIEENDRRHTIFNCENPLDTEISEALSPDLNPGYLEKELKDFVSYLKDMEVTFDEVKNLFLTDAKTKLIEVSRDSVDRFMEDLKNIKNIKEFCKVFEHPFAISQDKNFNSFILSRDLYNLYLHWCSKNSITMTKSVIGFGMKLSRSYQINSGKDRNIESNGQRYYLISDLFE